MEKGKISLLKAEIQAQTEEIEKIYRRLAERAEEKGSAALESTSFQLHNLYCAFEDLFQIVAGAFENSIHETSRYHIEILKRMTVKIEGVRPALISAESFQLLDTLRAFRHFFRHAYGYDLDRRKVEIVLEDAWKLKANFKREFENFLHLIETPT